MTDKRFFQKYQRIILWFFNTRLGRWYFRIQSREFTYLPQEKKILAVFPNAIRWEAKEGMVATEFRCNNRFGFRMYTLLKYMPFLRWEREFDWFPQLQVGLTHETYHPDANPETNTVDGQASRTNGISETLTVIRDGAGGHSADSGATTYQNRIQASTTTDQYSSIWRSIFLFDTSGIDDGDTIDSAIFSLYRTSESDGLSGASSDNSKVQLCSATPASNTALQKSDYGQVDTTDNGKSGTQASKSDNAYYDITLNSTGLANIDKTGITKFGLRYVWDADDTEVGLTWSSTGNQYEFGVYADTSGETQDPKLVVTHSVAVPDVMQSQTFSKVIDKVDVY